MNLILLFPTDFDTNNSVTLSDSRFNHLKTVLKVDQEQTIRVGLINGLIGDGTVTLITEKSISLNITLSEEPPKSLPVTLICALPRPKTFRKVLHAATVMGVKEIHFFKSWRVEKSYWSSPTLTEQAVKEVIYDGLQQCRDTIMPKVSFHKLFKPFVEDILPTISEHSEKIVFHPSPTASRYMPEESKKYSLVIGPEGGFIPYEIELLQKVGFLEARLGARIMRVEQAVDTVLGHTLISTL